MPKVDLAPVVLYVGGLRQQERVAQEPCRGELSRRRRGLERVSKRRDDPSGLRCGHEERGVQVLAVEVFLRVALLYLPPHLDHGVPLGPVPEKAHTIRTQWQ